LKGTPSRTARRAGKTTTMRMILGLDRPTAGSVTANGKPFAELYSAMREVGALLGAKAVHGGRSAYITICWGEFAVFSGYAAVLLALGAWAFIRRDA
jgi:ABC-type cobalamin/Fe3+-siderophores transport system ATPase subunit